MKNGDRERMLVENVERKRTAIRRLRLALRGLIPHVAADEPTRRYAEATLDETYGESQ